MDTSLRADLTNWASMESDWISRLLRGIEADETWFALVRVLGAYARSGRFAQLDRLAHAPSPPPNPRPLWDEVEQAVLRARPELVGELHRVSAPGLELQQGAIAQIREAVATSLATWWFTITRAGAFGAFGEEGRFLLEAEPRMALPALPERLLRRVE